MSSVIVDHRVPSGEARAVPASAGQVIQIEDLEGRQVGDLVAYRADVPGEYLSPAHTCSCLVKLVPAVGDDLYSNHRTPLMRILRDDVGTHDLVVPCCDPERYERDYGLTDHRSCLVGLRQGLADFGSDWPVRGELAWNVFMNNRLEDGRIVTYEPEHGAGATIELEALVDLVVCLVACPQDLSPCNAYNPTDMAIRVLER